MAVGCEFGHSTGGQGSDEATLPRTTLNLAGVLSGVHRRLCTDRLPEGPGVRPVQKLCWDRHRRRQSVSRPQGATQEAREPFKGPPSSTVPSPLIPQSPCQAQPGVENGQGRALFLESLRWRLYQGAALYRQPMGEERAGQNRVLFPEHYNVHVR